MTRWRNDRTFSKLVRSLLGQLCVVLPGGGSARSLDCTAGFIMKKSRVGMTTQRRSYRSFQQGERFESQRYYHFTSIGGTV